MSITSMPLRRLITTIGVIGALVLGYGTIKAAATWTAASAPLTVAPVSVSSLQTRLATEQARSAALEGQLLGLAARSTDLSVALEAAQARIAADVDGAADLTKDLKAARKKLVRLEATIRATRAAAAKRASAGHSGVASNASGGGEDEDEDEDEDGR